MKKLGSEKRVKMKTW